MEREPDSDYRQATAELGAAALAALATIEAVQRRLHPPALPELRAAVAPRGERVAQALASHDALSPPPGLEDVHAQLTLGARRAGEACRLFAQEAPADSAVPRILEAMRSHCRAQEALYPLRRVFPPLGRYFAELPFHDRLNKLEGDASRNLSVGVHRGGADGESRGGFSFYVPESYDGASDWPLVVALHGGTGSGRDFLWTWLREARSRRFLLLAPTSRDSTWSLHGADLDGPALRSMIDFVSKGWRVDASRILLTGLSDGATYALLHGLSEGAPFTAIAPVSGVLHPANLGNGNLDRARGRRIYLVHGALDWMFPVALARMARDALEGAGADLSYREIEDLSHTYPREENDRILSWFDPSLALAEEPSR